MTHWMLEEIGCPYRVEVKAFGPDMKTPDYLAINPMGKVPVIVHGRRCRHRDGRHPLLSGRRLSTGRPRAAADEERESYYRWLFFVAGCCEPAMANKATGWNPDTPELKGAVRLWLL